MSLSIFGKKNILLAAGGLVVAGMLYLLSNSLIGSLIFWMLVMFLCFSAVVLLLPQGKINVSVTGPQRKEKFVPCHFRILTEQTFFSAAKNGVIWVQVENLLTGERRREEIPILGRLRDKGRQNIAVEDSCCGSLQVSLEEIHWHGFFQILYRRVPLQVRTSCLILPSLFNLEEREDLWDAYDVESYKYSQASKGSDPGEVFSLREYASGDSPRHIHWKLSGKLSQIIVKELSLPIDNKLMILMDKDGSQLPLPRQRSDAMELCGSLSSTALQRGIPHSIGWYDHLGGGFRTHPVRSESDLWGALESMLKVGFWEDEGSTVYRYLESEMDKQYRNIIYVSQEGKDMERLSTYGQVHLYRPGREQ